MLIYFYIALYSGKFGDKMNNRSVSIWIVKNYIRLIVHFLLFNIKSIFCYYKLNIVYDLFNYLVGMQCYNITINYDKKIIKNVSLENYTIHTFLFCSCFILKVFFYAIALMLSHKTNK